MRVASQLQEIRQIAFHLRATKRACTLTKPLQNAVNLTEYSIIRLLTNASSAARSVALGDVRAVIVVDEALEAAHDEHEAIVGLLCRHNISVDAMRSHDSYFEEDTMILTSLNVPAGHTPYSWGVSMESIRSPPAAHTASSWGPAAVLLGVSRVLRDVESSPDFSRDRFIDVDAAQGVHGHSDENFAYGTTPISSMCHFFPRDQIDSSPAGKIIVLGSSTGFISFYIALIAAPTRDVEGVEMLPSLVRIATDCKHRLGVENVNFLCGDMMCHDISTAAVLILTSQCCEFTQRVVSSV